MSIPISAQAPSSAISVGEAIQHTLHASSLTDHGKPFHAIIAISNPKNPSSTYRATIEVFWQGIKSYRTVITSPAFSQTRIVQGDQVEEHNTGNFYPPWLQNYLTAILNPLHLPNAFQNASGQIFLGDHMRSCQRHDDRTGGITNNLTFANICFAGNDAHLESMDDFTYAMIFSDYQHYQKQSIAFTYQSGMDGNDPVVGKLTLLEPLADAPALFTITTPTPPADRIETTAVSTLKEESLVERSDNSPWPPIRDGKTDGYMIIHAVTDRTGQVRSASKYNSDNAELEYAAPALCTTNSSHSSSMASHSRWRCPSSCTSPRTSKTQYQSLRAMRSQVMLPAAELQHFLQAFYQRAPPSTYVTSLARKARFMRKAFLRPTTSSRSRRRS
jgi:hypothetical protein